MWVFTNKAFVSAVRHRHKPGMLMVRARLAGDLERFFATDTASLDVRETRAADYRFRCTVSNSVFADALMRAADTIDYANFKNSIAHADHLRHDAYMDVWSAMYRAQGRHG